MSLLHDLGYEVEAIVYFTLFYAALPALLIWGWIRFLQRPRYRGILSVLSAVSLSLATASVLLGAGTDVYARAIGGFPHYDPRLLRIEAWGTALSFAALLLAVVAVWRPNRTRWHSLAASLLVLLFWLFTASTE